MSWWRNLLRWADAPTPERNDAVVRFSYDIPTPIDDAITQAAYELSGIPVRREVALTVPAVLRGRNLLCSIATLPLVTRDQQRFAVRAPLLEQIDPAVPNVVTLSQTIEDLIFEGWAWWRVVERDPQGFPRRAIHVDVAKVHVQAPPAMSTSALRALPSGAELGGEIWVDGVQVDPRDMIRFDSPNPGLLKAAARSVRRALLLERAAALYAEDPKAQDYFAPADGADPITDDEVAEFLDEWRSARRKRTTAYVPAALEYHTVDAMSPADLQLVELQRQAVVDIANALGIDAEDLQVSTTSRTYANAIDRRRDRINDTLAPYMRAITDRLSMNDVTRRGYRVEFDLNDYLRADPTTRWNTYQVGLSNEIVTVPEVRAMEGLPAIPVEQQPANGGPPRPSRDPAVPISEAPTMPRTAARAHFSADADGTHRIAFELPADAAQFRVDPARRVVSGLLLPWNRVAKSGYAKWRFAKDSVRWTDTTRVKLNREHDRHQAIGYATRLESTDAGLVGTFKIARGAAGDEVLSLAEDKVLDGFSVEVEFDEDGSGWSRDPNDDMVRLVHSARLVGTAITAAPAFDDARVTGVAASRYRKEEPMPDEPKGNVQEAPAAGPDQAAATAAFTAAVEAFTNHTDTLSQAITALVEAQQNSDGPEFVDPTRPTAQFRVNEAPLYRFDGTRGEYDFSTDVIAMSKKDHEAEARVIGWIKENFANIRRGSAQFAVDVADAAALNPARQRPDLYVDQLEYPTPLWDSINKGTIADNTPFVLPKFQSASGLVNNHTEGTEPTPGAFTTTSQTITPSAVSGKVEVTREAWDQGGNPQLSVILWRQMVRQYFEALEQAAADLLNSLTVAEITISAGAADAALASEVKAALAALHFIRGGFRFRDLKLERVLYQALVDAVDGNGRPLFPVLGAQNADGTAGTLFGALNIAGLVGMPAWALPSTDGSPNNSYLYNREDVHGWASAPQRLDFEYRVAYVDVGVWGYKALACTRTDGVRRFIYDSTGA